MAAKKSQYYSILADDKDERIAELEEELENARRAGGGKKGGAGGPSVPLAQLHQEIDFLEQSLRDAKNKYFLVEEETDLIKDENKRLIEALKHVGTAARDKALVDAMKHQVEIKNNELQEARTLIDELQKVGWSNLPQKVVDDCKKAKQLVDDMKKQVEEARAGEQKAKVEYETVNAKVDALNKAYEGEKKAHTANKEALANEAQKRQAQINKVHHDWEQKESRRSAMDQKQVEALEYQISQLKVAAMGQFQQFDQGPAPAAAASPATKKRGTTPEPPAVPAGAPAKGAGPGVAAGPSSEQAKQMIQQINVLKQQNIDLLAKLKTANTGSAGPKAAVVDTKQLDEQAAFFKKKLADKETEITTIMKKVKAAEAVQKGNAEADKKVKELEKVIVTLKAENNTILENYQTELVLRKKYYNMVEDMKGKIRVYCRARPISKAELDRGNVECVTYVDEYTISVMAQRGPKEFQFDKVFSPVNPQTEVFEDTSNLIQSAVDGFNVCIFAYGQTGSGKTFTLIGDPVNNPGIAPRAFKKIFELGVALGKKYEIQMSAYMLELYNDKLLDLFSSSTVHSDKLDIKKDARGLVYIPGAEVKSAKSEKELADLFDTGSKRRHTACTKMNSESSRSHLVLSILIETTNVNTKKTNRGKLSVIDLAGSERVGKTGATDDRLKEANSINQSLSALGDVIAALTSDEQFVPYRNNKLTMLMQDSLGGNAKTLMFVNISPVDYNAPESVNSLNYASRVKLVKNDASKNVDNEEVSRLKKMIEKLKKGEKVE